jgi:hypothetical protein
LKEYLRWDDWRVLGLLADGAGGEHGTRLARRAHYREVYHTPETPRQADLEGLTKAKEVLGDLLQAEESADKSWYKVGEGDIPVLGGIEGRAVRPLSDYSSVVANIEPIRKVMLYARPEDAGQARQRLRAALGGQ